MSTLTAVEVQEQKLTSSPRPSGSRGLLHFPALAGRLGGRGGGRGSGRGRRFAGCLE